MLGSNLARSPQPNERGPMKAGISFESSSLQRRVSSELDPPRTLESWMRSQLAPGVPFAGSFGRCLQFLSRQHLWTTTNSAPVAVEFHPHCPGGGARCFDIG